MDNFNLCHFLEFIGEAVKEYYVTDGTFPDDSKDVKAILEAAKDYSNEIITHLQRLDKIETMSNIKLKNKALQ